MVAGNLFGGVESMLLTLARYHSTCPGLGQAFAVCFEGRLASELDRQGATVHRLGPVRASRPWSVLEARRVLGGVLDDGGYDWLICHGAWPLGLLGPATRGRSARLAFWMHDSAAGKSWVERYAKRARPNLAICNSQHTARSLPTLFKNLAFTVLHCPVPPPEPLSPGKRGQLRSQFGATEAEFVILIAARFEEWKGHRFLIDALAACSDVPSWRLWVAGAAQRPHEELYRAALKEDVEKHRLSSRVLFLGQRTDVPDLMAAADLYCQPNTGPEPFGISFVEALYAGLPVVTSAFGGALEIVTSNCGQLVPPGDSAALVRALRLALGDKTQRESAGVNGPRRAAELCDPARQLSRLEQSLAGAPA